jgi:hypothetical protein
MNFLKAQFKCALKVLWVELVLKLCSSNLVFSTLSIERMVQLIQSLIRARRRPRANILQGAQKLREPLFLCKFHVNIRAPLWIQLV